MKVACGQFTVSSNVTKNFEIIKKLMHQSIRANVEVLFLPEASDYLSKNPQHSLKLSKTTNELLIKPIQQELKQIHQNGNQLFVSIGIHEPDVEHGKTINKLLWIDHQGEIVHEYSKLHLFDVNIKNGPILKESNSVTKGCKILSPFTVPINPKFKIGYQICYDIRFPELSTLLFKNGANILTFPSAFTVKTGESHWKNLGRTRAIDNQCFVIMAAQCGEHNLVDDDDDGEVVKRVSYGNSLIIDPWGDILVEGLKWDDNLPKDDDGDYYELLVADLDYDRVLLIRQNMPLLDHRRHDIYQLSSDNVE